MLTYEFGLLVAFLIWAWSVVARIQAVNSTMARNFAKVGQRISWSNGAPTVELPLGGRGWKRFLLLVSYEAVSLVMVLTSWLYVLIAGARILHHRAKDRGVPASIQEFRWKIRNIDLSFDDMVREVMKIAGDPPEKFEDIRAEVLEIVKQRRAELG